MKKRLFITSALMTAVMAASLATGTYAWYSANTEGGGVQASAQNLNTATVNPTISLGKVSLDVNLTEVDATSELTFATPTGGAYNQNWSSFYLNKSNEKVEFPLTSGKASAGDKHLVYSKAYKVSVSVKVSDITGDDKAKQQEFNNRVASLVGTYISISVKDTAEVDDTRVHEWVVSTQDTSPNNTLADDAPRSNNATSLYNLPAVTDGFGTLTAPKSIEVAYVAVYVEGEHIESESSNQVADEGPYNIGFTVTIDKSASAHA